MATRTTRTKRDLKTSKKLGGFKSYLTFLMLVMSHHVGLASNAYEACDDMMGKLSVQYEFVTLENRLKGIPFNQRNLVRRAESVVIGAYGLDKKELDKLWPRLWQFAVLTFIDATRDLPDSDAFRQRAFLACVREFG